MFYVIAVIDGTEPVSLTYLLNNVIHCSQTLQLYCKH